MKVGDYFIYKEKVKRPDMTNNKLYKVYATSNEAIKNKKILRTLDDVESSHWITIGECEFVTNQETVKILFDKQTQE